MSDKERGLDGCEPEAEQADGSLEAHNYRELAPLQESSRERVRREVEMEARNWLARRDADGMAPAGVQYRDLFFPEDPDNIPAQLRADVLQELRVAVMRHYICSEVDRTLEQTARYREKSATDQNSVMLDRHQSSLVVGKINEKFEQIIHQRQGAIVPTLPSKD